MLGNFVFDIDGTIAVAADSHPEEVEELVKKALGEDFYHEHRIDAVGYPHYVFPGYPALFQWLHKNGGKIFFFSTGIEERNLEFTEKLMKKSFGENSKVEYKVFSRQHCIDTTLMWEEEGKKYQSYFYGQKKKKLAGIVVPEEELSNTVLIEDDCSYMVKGEEYNMIRLRWPDQYIQRNYQHDVRNFYYFHRAYYLAGLFSKIFEVREEKKISLIESAKYVQIDSEGDKLDRDFYYPVAWKLDYFKKGMEILREIDPSIKFFFDVPAKPYVER